MCSPPKQKALHHSAARLLRMSTAKPVSIEGSKSWSRNPNNSKSFMILSKLADILLTNAGLTKPFVMLPSADNPRRCINHISNPRVSSHGKGLHELASSPPTQPSTEKTIATIQSKKPLRTQDQIINPMQRKKKEKRSRLHPLLKAQPSPGPTRTPVFCSGRLGTKLLVEETSDLLHS